jgi:predicted peroxiredoxin
MDAPEKLVIIVTHGAAEAELATVPFVMAAAALASDVEVVMAFQGDAVGLLTKIGPEDIHAHGFPPLAELMSTVSEFGGQLLACAPCLEAREIGENYLREGIEVIGAARLIAEITSATSTLTY